MRKIALICALVLIFTIPWETAITISSLGTLTRLIGVGAAGIWVVSVLMTGRLRKINGYHDAVLIFVIWNIASLFWTVDYDLTMTRVKTYLQLAMLIWILWDLLTTPESLRLAMQVFIFGAYLTIASQLSNLAAGQTIAAYSEGRFTGAGQNAVELALILSLSLPMAWFLATTQKRASGAAVLRVINLAYIPLALLATFLTASRTSLVTVIPGLLYIAGTMRKIKPYYRLAIFFAVILAFLLLQPLIPSATLSRLSTFGSSISENDLGGRTRLWVGSLAIFLDHPWLGIGSNALSAPGELGSYAHNTFLSIMAELGLAGLILFLWVLADVAYQALKQPKPFSILWVTMLAIWMIGAFTLTWEYTKTTWYVFSLVVISAGASQPQAELQETSPVTDEGMSRGNYPVA